MGTVYIANTAPALAAYQVNSGSTFTCRPCSAGVDLPIWTPRFVSAPQQAHKARGQFGVGANTLSVTFQGLDPVDPGHAFEVTIPPDHSLLDPVILYAFLGLLGVMTSDGRQLLPNPPIVTGEPLS